MKLMCGDKVIGKIITNHWLTIEECLEILQINIDDLDYEELWMDWTY